MNNVVGVDGHSKKILHLRRICTRGKNRVMIEQYIRTYAQKLPFTPLKEVLIPACPNNIMLTLKEGSQRSEIYTIVILG